MADEWPVDCLDVDGLVANGWRPVPFHQFVLKVHSRCDLACDYCYVYRMADHGWLDTRSTMSPEVLHQTCVRIAEHARRHGLDRVEVVFHGGEPLLAGPSVLAEAAATLRRLVPGTVDLGVQTNALRLDDSMLRVLEANDIRVAVSLDGAEGTHDRHRRSAGGRGSHQRTCEAIRRLRTPPYHRLFSGLLCVVDVEADPVDTYEALLVHEPPRIDFLLPHANWSIPPRRGDADAPHGDWLIAVFDRWYGSPRQETEIRLFQEIVNLALGGRSRSEAIGLSPVALVVVDTDGQLEQVDSLRSAYHGAASTGLDVRTHSFDDALSHPSIVARQIGLDALVDSCRSCDVVRVCGGGYYPHRYREGSGFRHASVYCPDLVRLIGHVLRRVRADVVGLRGRGC